MNTASTENATQTDTTDAAAATPTLPTGKSEGAQLIGGVKEAIQAKIDASQKSEAGKTSQNETAAGAGVAAPYTPNFKFRVHKEEKEIPEMFRALVKDEKSEKEIREIFEKAHGLDFQKPKYEQLKTDHAELSDKWGQLDRSLKQLSKFVSKDDLGAFFEHIDVPFEQVARFVLRELKKKEMPEDERQRMTQYETDRRNLIRLEQENEELRTNSSESIHQARRLELQTSLARPEIAQLASQVDAVAGERAFLNEVISRGITHYQMTKEELPVEQVVNEVFAKWKGLMGKFQPGPTPNPTSMAAPQAPKPTIPNVGGSSGSPIKQAPRSLDDLKKLANSFSQ